VSEIMEIISGISGIKGLYHAEPGKESGISERRLQSVWEGGSVYLVYAYNLA